MKNVSLKTFLRGTSKPADLMPGCANYDHHYGGCLYSKTCQVENGKRCGYFEKAVLPTAADIGQMERIFKLYYKQVGKKEHSLLSLKIRRCPDCGGELLKRQRLCGKCTVKNRKVTQRKYNRTRKGSVTIVKEKQLSEVTAT